MALMGVVLVGAGAWKMWSAYSFAGTARKVQGTFTGYHDVWGDSDVEDAHGFKTKAKETYPTFSFVDEQGRTHHITGTDAIVFQRLESGDAVDILVSHDDPDNARLASPYYLYGGGGLLSLGGFSAVLLLFYGLRALAHFGGPSAEVRETGFLAALQSFLQMKLPVGNLVIVGGGFVLVAGAVIGFGAYFIVQRQDPALIQAMEAGEFDAARILALRGKGIEGKNAAGEPALIVALKENRPEVARAILSHWTSTNVVTANGTSAVELAAAHGDPHTLAALLKKGAETFGLNPSIVHGLVVKGDTETLRVVFSSSFSLDTEYLGLSYGDHAVVLGKADVVRLIQEYNGPFKAPSAFIALALDDEDALKAALQRPNACRTTFQKLSLPQFAKKIDKTDMLEKLGGCDEPHPGTDEK